MKEKLVLLQLMQKSSDREQYKNDRTGKFQAWAFFTWNATTTEQIPASRANAPAINGRANAAPQGKSAE